MRSIKSEPSIELGVSNLDSSDKEWNCRSSVGARELDSIGKEQIVEMLAT